MNSKISVKSGDRYLETKRVGESMMDYAHSIGSEALRSYGEEMLRCGSSPVVLYDDSTGKRDYMITPQSCKRRGCPPCEAKKNQAHKKFLMSQLKERGTDNFYFLTVTVPAVSIIQLKEQSILMGKQLSLLRRRQVLNFVKGGFRSFESNFNHDSQTFNPHFHTLLETSGEDLSNHKHILKFISNSPFFEKALSDYLNNNSTKIREKVLKSIYNRLKKGELHQILWSGLLQSVGLGAICNIQKVSDIKNAERETPEELCKYLTKTMRLEGDLLPQFLLAMKGKKLFSSWGSLSTRGVVVEDSISTVEDDSADEKAPVQRDWKYFGFLNQVAIRAVEQGGAEDQLILGLAVEKEIIEVDYLPALSNSG